MNDSAAVLIAACEAKIKELPDFDTLMRGETAKIKLRGVMDILKNDTQRENWN